jgi:hypothetical protein
MEGQAMLPLRTLMRKTVSRCLFTSRGMKLKCLHIFESTTNNDDDGNGKI